MQDEGTAAQIALSVSDCITLTTGLCVCSQHFALLWIASSLPLLSSLVCQMWARCLEPFFYCCSCLIFMYSVIGKPVKLYNCDGSSCTCFSCDCILGSNWVTVTRRWFQGMLFLSLWLEGVKGIWHNSHSALPQARWWAEPDWLKGFGTFFFPRAKRWSRFFNTADHQRSLIKCLSVSFHVLFTSFLIYLSRN